MIKGLIIGHRDIGKAVIEALESISGHAEHVDCISNEGLSTDDLAEKIKSFCRLNCQDGIILFVDVFGGSCWRAAKKAKSSNAHIVTGLNLPMLLSFVQKRETLSIDELPSVMETDGKRAIMNE